METPTPVRPIAKLLKFWADRSRVVIAGVALTGIALHLILRYGVQVEPFSYQIPLWIVLGFGGVPLLFGLLRKLANLEFGSDLLAGLSIVTAVALSVLAGRAFHRLESGRRDHTGVGRGPRGATTHTSGRMWAGNVTNHLYLIALVVV